MRGRLAWRLLACALVPGAVLCLGFREDGRGVGRPAAEGARSAEGSAPLLETRARPALLGTDAATTGAAPRTPEQWPYRVHTNVPGATVTLRVEGLGEAPPPAPVTRTADADGFAGFEAPDLGVPYPLVEASVEAPGYRSLRRRLVDHVARMTLTRAYAVRGHVVGADGKPLEAAVLRLDGVAVRSRSDGSFTAFAETRGRLRLSAGHRAHMRRHLLVEVPSRDVVVELERGARIDGRVTFPDGAPVAGVPVRVYASLVYGVTGADGTYRLQGLVPGQGLRLGVMGRWQFFAAGSRTADLVVHDHAVHIDLRSASGQGAQDLYVTSHHVREGGVDGRAWGWAKDGRFLARAPVSATVSYAWTAPHVEVGTRQLVTDPEPRAYYLTETLRPLRARGELALLAPPSARERGPLRLDVLLPTGVALPGFEDLSFEADADGRMVLGPLPTGRFGVDLAGYEEVWTTVLPDEVTTVSLRPPR